MSTVRDAADFETMRFERDGHVLTVTIDPPSRR